MKVALLSLVSVLVLMTGCGNRAPEAAPEPRVVNSADATAAELSQQFANAMIEGDVVTALRLMTEEARTKGGFNAATLAARFDAFLARERGQAGAQWRPLEAKLILTGQPREGVDYVRLTMSRTMVPSESWSEIRVYELEGEGRPREAKPSHLVVVLVGKEVSRFGFVQAGTPSDWVSPAAE